MEEVAVAGLSVKVVAELRSFLHEPLFHEKTLHLVIELGFVTQDLDEVPFGRATRFRIDAVQEF